MATGVGTGVAAGVGAGVRGGPGRRPCDPGPYGLRHEEAQSQDLAAERNSYWLNVCLFTQYGLDGPFLHVCLLYNCLTN